MPWARIDDQFIFHEKARLAGKEGRNLQITALCYCASQLNDGYIKEGLLPTIFALAECDDGPATVAKLVEVGMWEVAEGGYQIHDYLHYNRSRAEVMAEREATAKRQADWQSKHRSANGKYNGVNNGVSNSVINDEITTTPYPYPYPSPYPSPYPNPEEVELIQDEANIQPTSEPPKLNGAAKAAKVQPSPKEKPPKAPYTPFELLYCEETGRVPGRLMPGERKQLQECETKHGLTTCSNAVKWAVGNKITGIARIAKAAETMAQNNGNGKHASKPEPLRGIKASKETEVLWCPFCEKPELQCVCGDDVIGPWADTKIARMGDRIYATLDELEEMKAAGDPYKWAELQTA